MIKHICNILIHDPPIPSVRELGTWTQHLFQRMVEALFTAFAHVARYMPFVIASQHGYDSSFS